MSFKIYVIQFPVNYHPRIMAFKNREKAQEVCDAFNKDRPISTNRKGLEISELIVLEDSDIKI